MESLNFIFFIQKRCEISFLLIFLVLVDAPYTKNQKDFIILEEIIGNKKHLIIEHKGDITWNLSTKYLSLKLNNDEYYVIGDNRDNSVDSRHIGTIKRK